MGFREVLTIERPSPVPSSLIVRLSRRCCRTVVGSRPSSADGPVVRHPTVTALPGRRGRRRCETVFEGSSRVASGRRRWFDCPRLRCWRCRCRCCPTHRDDGLQRHRGRLLDASPFRVSVNTSSIIDSIRSCAASSFSTWDWRSESVPGSDSRVARVRRAPGRP